MFRGKVKRERESSILAENQIERDEQRTNRQGAKQTDRETQAGQTGAGATRNRETKKRREIRETQTETGRQIDKHINRQTQRQGENERLTDGETERWRQSPNRE